MVAEHADLSAGRPAVAPASSPATLAWTCLYFLRDKFKIGRKARRERSRALFEAALKDAGVARLAIDGGANVGAMTAKLVDAGFEVIAFEPDPEAADRLMARLGDHANVTLHRKALSTETGTATLYRHKDYAPDRPVTTESSTIIGQRKTDEKNALRIDVIDFPAFVENEDRRIGILKLDIEGAETEIMHTLLDRGLIDRIDRVFVETHERFSTGLAWRTAQVRARVRQAGLTHVNLDHP